MFDYILIIHYVIRIKKQVNDRLNKVKDGDDVRADAVVFMPEPTKMIYIDSKFPFPDYAKMYETEGPNEKELLKKDFVGLLESNLNYSQKNGIAFLDNLKPLVEQEKD